MKFILLLCILLPFIHAVTFPSNIGDVLLFIHKKIFKIQGPPSTQIPKQPLTVKNNLAAINRDDKNHRNSLGVTAFSQTKFKTFLPEINIPSMQKHSKKRYRRAAPDSEKLKVDKLKAIGKD